MAKVLRARAICGHDASQGARIVFRQPLEQCGTHIEADQSEVVDDSLDAIVVVDQPTERVGAVALVVDAFVPVHKRQRARLVSDDARPRVLAWRLVEVTVQNQPLHS
jgi:hypothetical protein